MAICSPEDMPDNEKRPAVPRPTDLEVGLESTSGMRLPKSASPSASSPESPAASAVPSSSTPRDNPAKGSVSHTVKITYISKPEPRARNFNNFLSCEDLQLAPFMEGYLLYTLCEYSSMRRIAHLSLFPSLSFSPSTALQGVFSVSLSFTN